ncbi:GNAT family N-acetyltransferase [Streptomyces kebangsaanensis]|uniref:GNAT family N-acetyltransferase n=1 Tax=Streptomyces kebangsaanensis TaxID=864058 RepID=UPI002278D601|nr:GNAT family N-acetyltransferase [Streptomyces kebangsaanensis]
MRRPTEDDVDAIRAIHSDPAACAHHPSDALAERSGAERLHRRWDDRWRRHGYGYRVVRQHGAARALGFCGVRPMDLAGLRILNLFYRFAPAAWGRGLAGEAATAVVT